MSQTLLFLPDISGYTEFINSTEIEHSQHVVAELLELMIESNKIDLKLAEIEGDALFFYKENFNGNKEELLAQIEQTFTVFHSHLELLRRDRICPCNACATAPNLKLKIVAHLGDVQFIEVNNQKKPFGPCVIKVHRLLKNSTNLNNYVLLSAALTERINLNLEERKPFDSWSMGKDEYDGEDIHYSFAEIDIPDLNLIPHEPHSEVCMTTEPSQSFRFEMPTNAKRIFELLTNYKYRKEWFSGVEDLLFEDNEVTRLGSKHVCVINSQSLNFITVTKKGKEGQLVYGELTEDVPILDELYQFFILTPVSDDSSMLEVELYAYAKSPIKKLMYSLLVKKQFKKNVSEQMQNLRTFLMSMDGN